MSNSSFGELGDTNEFTSAHSHASDTCKCEPVFNTMDLSTRLKQRSSPSNLGDYTINIKYFQT